MKQLVSTILDMSKVKGVCFKKFGIKKTRNPSFTSMVNSILRKTKAIDSIKFFLDGKYELEEVSGMKSARCRRDETEIEHSTYETNSVLNTFEDNSSDNQNEICQNFEYNSSKKIKFKRTLKKLKEKMNKLWNKYPGIVRPNVNTFYDGEKFYIDIPLLHNCEEFLKCKFINNGSIYISIDEDDVLSQVKLVLEKSCWIEDSDLDLLIETYEQSLKFNPFSLKLPQAWIGKAFNKNLSQDLL